MGTGTGAPHILLVDESPEIRELFTRTLRAGGFRVTPASEMQDLGTVQRLAPDCIIQEFLFHQDDTGSLAFLRALRHDAELADIPVLLLTTARDTIYDTTLAAELHALEVSVLLKPIHLEDFLTGVRMVCRASRHHAPAERE